MLKHVVEGIVAFVILGFLLRLLERFFPSTGGQRAPIFHRTRVVDVLHWFIGGPMGRAISEVGLFAAIVAFIPMIIFLRHGQWSVAAPAHAFSGMPMAMQIPIALFTSDFFGYVSHRLHHRVALLWRLHAVHHSSKQLDWLSAARSHPLGELTGRLLVGMPLIFCGIEPRVMLGILPFVGLYAILLHANVPFRFGPLRYVIATPLFHRWHHSSQPEARDKNFSALFPIWDLAFGTFYCPNEQPSQFGVDDDVPEGFVGQLLFPLRGVFSSHFWSWIRERIRQRGAPLRSALPKIHE